MKRSEWESRAQIIIWVIALGLIFTGLFFTPMHLRDPFIRLLDKGLKGYSKVNVLAAAGCLILVFCSKKYSRGDKILSVLWVFLLLLLLLSDRTVSLRKVIPAVFNSWLPLYLIYQRMDQHFRKRLVQVFLIVFDLFVVLLLIYGVYERVTGGKLMAAAVQWFADRHVKASELIFYQTVSTEGGDFRLCTFWGYALTNGVLFNAFFIVNDIYFRSIGKKYPRFLFFMISLGGVLLTISKVAIVVSVLYLVICNWKDKRWLLVYACAAIVMFFLGFFQKIIYRFANSPLTTGRVDAMIKYFGGDLYPLRFLIGYGTGTTYGEEMYHLKPAFEPPLLMYALDYGILFSLIFIISVYIYVSYHFLKRKQIISWIGISLLYAQINTYNGMSLWNQDCCWMMALLFMIAVNAVMLADDHR